MASSKTHRLEAIETEITACRRCPRLVGWREKVAREKRRAFRDESYWGRPVAGFGDPNARVVVVGLAPAAHGANRTGRMFTGDRSGEWLFRALHRAGFANQPHSSPGDGLILTDAWVTAVVKCAPPSNKPTITERDACIDFLQRELKILPVEVCVAMGGFAWATLLQTFDVRPRARFAHGAEASGSNGVSLVASYHPSQQNTFTGRLTEDMLDDVFRRARQLVRGESLPPC